MVFVNYRLQSILGPSQFDSGGGWQLDSDPGRSSTMPEIRHQQPGASPGISFAEIHIPNDSDFGTGTYSITLTPRALLSNKAITSIMVNRPRFQISATINPNRDIPVLLGRGSPVDQVVFRLPQGLDFRLALTLRIEFAGWQISAAAINGQQLGKNTDPVSN